MRFYGYWTNTVNVLVSKVTALSAFILNGVSMVTAHVLVARQGTIKVDFCDINHEHFQWNIRDDGEKPQIGAPLVWCVRLLSLMRRMLGYGGRFSVRAYSQEPLASASAMSLIIDEAQWEYSHQQAKEITERQTQSQTPASCVNWP